MSLRPCPSCAELLGASDCSCPHCGARTCGARSTVSGAAALLGLALVACGPDKDDTGGTGTTAGMQPEYGVPTTSSVNEAAAQHAEELSLAILEYGPEQPSSDQDLQ